MRKVLLLIALSALVGPALADGDHDRARAALREGRIRPLAEILAVVESRFGGRVIEVEFEREDGRYVYDLELVTEAGQLLEVNVDAATGEVLEQEIEEVRH